jgi:hypothetical protein
MFFRIPDGKSPQNPVIPSVIHHHQNPLESTGMFWFQQPWDYFVQTAKFNENPFYLLDQR